MHVWYSRLWNWAQGPLQFKAVREQGLGLLFFIFGSSVIFLPFWTGIFHAVDFTFSIGKSSYTTSLDFVLTFACAVLRLACSSGTYGSTSPYETRLHTK